MRQLLRACGRQADERLHDARAAGPRPGRRHYRRFGQGQDARHHSAEIHRLRRGTVRLLHARIDPRRESVAKRKSASESGRVSRRHGRQHLPLHRLQQDPAGVRTRRRCDGAEEMTTAKSSSAYEQHEMKVVGKGALRLDARGKVTGDTKYGQDLFTKKFLFAKVLRTAHPHAEILGINTSAAKKLPGVVAVFTHKDVTGTNLHGLIRRDQEALCSRKVRYLGDAIAIVVAKDELTAIEATKHIRVDYKPLPAVFTFEEALKPDAPKIHAEGNVLGEKHLRKGDAPKAMAEAVVVVEDTVQTLTVDHAFLDLEAGRAKWDGKMLTIEVPGQWIHEECRLNALALGLPVEKVRIIQPATGGAFGGREDISIQIYLGLCALKLKGKTICMRYTRSESKIVRHKRHPIRIHYKLGAKKDGTLVAAQITFYVDKGAYASTGIAVMRKASSHATGPYKVPNVWVDVIGVFTNNNPCGAMRGFGAAQTAISYEGLMDRLATKLGMDKAELRMENLIKSGDTVTTGQVVPYATAEECFNAVLNRIDWKNRSYATPAPHRKNRRRNRGRSTRCSA